MNITEMVNCICPIAVDAGDAIMKIYEESKDIVYEKKDDDSPLTAADKASNDIICQALQKLAFDYPIISEENKSIDFSTRSQFKRYWLVDPLDGTKEFIKRNGEFTVNIALVEENHVIGGVVYAPALEKLFWAFKNEGAYLKDKNGTSRLEGISFSSTDASLKVICSRSHMNTETTDFVNQLNDPELVSKGSSLKFLELAQGVAHLYPRVAPTMEWDTAAAQIVLEEAGGKVVQFGTDSKVVYNKENLLNPYFVAYADKNVLIK